MKICYRYMTMFSVNLHLFTILHFAAMAGLALYGMHRIWLLLCWYRESRGENTKGLLQSPEPVNYYPLVTVQLPLYNERFVAARLIDASAMLQWPKNRFEIQVLDDSDDDTVQIIDERVHYWSRKGITIHLLRRKDRTGFKAGALGYGLIKANGEFIAIFDADFLPTPDFLLRTVPCFSDPKIGMVQARWGFLNTEHSWLTVVQSLLLGQHFSIEHFVRFRRGLFFNFNGTAGIWRRQAIESAGGWQSDTVTEDLDLSYRAQLAGWRFIYCDDLVVSSELPATLAAFRSQQQRWAKGSVQTAKKVLPRLLAARLPLQVKCEAVAHLMANFCWFLGAIVTLTLYATITWRVSIGPYQMLRLDAPLFMTTSFILFLYFLIYAMQQERKVSFSRLLMLPILTIGIAPSITLSVIKGLLCSGGIFHRTPKFGLRGGERIPKMATLYRQQSLPYILMNTALFAYSLLPLLFVYQRGTWLAIPFVLLFPLGFLLVIWRDVMELSRVSPGGKKREETKPRERSLVSSA
jgi:cellulose synthase/poly-beta-1,6-N-acetylglucosamine synthase-like glycosyltransferase